jgi:hypothetical protein
MKFSYNAVWDHTVALLRAHLALAAAVAGVFIFLPMSCSAIFCRCRKEVRRTRRRTLSCSPTTGRKPGIGSCWYLSRR